MKYCVGLFLLIALTVMMSCNKKAESTLVPITEWYPLEVGKSFTYRLDSTVLINFGTSFAVRSYLIKDSVEATFPDATGRKSFRISRYMTDTLASQPYKYTTTFVSTFDVNKVEVMENNLRFISLVNPVSENTRWNGNSYISVAGINGNYNISYNGWDYNYIQLNQPYTVPKGTFENTVTVQQVDDNTAYSKLYSVEVYAKGVGLIYKEFFGYFYQTGLRNYDDGSYGIKLSLVDYK